MLLSPFLCDGLFVAGNLPATLVAFNNFQWNRTLANLEYQYSVSLIRFTAHYLVIY